MLSQIACPKDCFLLLNCIPIKMDSHLLVLCLKQQTLPHMAPVTKSLTLRTIMHVLHFTTVISPLISKLGMLMFAELGPKRSGPSYYTSVLILLVNKSFYFHILPDSHTVLAFLPSLSRHAKLFLLHSVAPVLTNLHQLQETYGVRFFSHIHG